MTSRSNSTGARLLNPLRDFLHEEAASGIVLALAALAALVWVNSPLADSYAALWSQKLSIGFGSASITDDLQHWVNDGLMAVFFFVVGLEIKRELVTGELRDPRAALMPVLAACGGVVLPAGIFLAVTSGTAAQAGWGIPMATDIAFALGVLALLGDRVPIGAKLFLLTIAIVDDMIAVTVIAFAYSDEISPAWLAAAAAGLIVVVAMHLVGVNVIWAYVPLWVAVWVATLESGVHATIAGVALGLLTPARPVRDRDLLGVLEHRLHPVSAFLIVPVFGLANAGVAVGADALAGSGAVRLSTAVVLGLLLGKTLGIACTALVARRLGVGVLPDGVNTRYLWGLASLAGIGFTVSLFIADLAYTDPEMTDVAKIGILVGSLAAAGLGAAILYPGRSPRTKSPDATAEGAVPPTKNDRLDL